VAGYFKSLFKQNFLLLADKVAVYLNVRDAPAAGTDGVVVMLITFRFVPFFAITEFNADNNSLGS